MTDFKEKDLVLLRLSNNVGYQYKQKHYNVWFRVMFIDNDGTFIGELEKKEQGFYMYNTKEHIRLDCAKVLSVYSEKHQWCYRDNVTLCNCKSLCRNK